ncbi:MAG: hypothetical protein NTY42_15355 [Planctomycetota bacterium]|nr:hypothetical protein [Planctomycetota bacterium]
MLEVVDQFHSQIGQIDRAKIPLILDSDSRLSIQEQLAELRKHFLSRDEEQCNVAKVLESGDFPANYRMALKFWLQGEYQRSLDQLSARAETRRYFHRSVQFVALQVMLIFGGVFVGLIATCVWLYPRVEEFSEPHFNEPGPGLRLLGTLRNTLPIWGIAVPLLVISMWSCWKLGLIRSRKKAMAAEFMWLRELGGLHGPPGQFRVWAGLAMVACGLSVLAFGVSLFWPAIELLLRVSEPSR